MSLSVSGIDELLDERLRGVCDSRVVAMLECRAESSRSDGEKQVASDTLTGNGSLSSWNGIRSSVRGGELTRCFFPDMVSMLSEDRESCKWHAVEEREKVESM